MFREEMTFNLSEEYMEGYHRGREAADRDHAIWLWAVIAACGGKVIIPQTTLVRGPDDPRSIRRTQDFLNKTEILEAIEGK